MKPPGTYKLRYNGRRAGFPVATVRGSASALDAASGVDGFLAELERDEHRAQRIVASLREEILEGGGGSNLRIRRVYRSPREVFRIELELPDLGYQRITFLDREALEALLEADDVREVVETAALGG